MWFLNAYLWWSINSIVIVFHGVTAKAYKSTKKKKRCTDVNRRYHVICGTESRWTARTLRWLEPCWQLEGPWASAAAQRVFDQSFHKSEKTDFINTLLFFLLYLVLPFIFFQSFTQRNYWIFYYNRVKGALYFILIFEHVSLILFQVSVNLHYRGRPCSRGPALQYRDGTTRTHLGTEFAGWAFSVARLITISWGILKCVFLYRVTEK